MIRRKKLFILTASLAFLFIFVHSAQTKSIKGKVQSRLDLGNSVQYEPYYTQTNYAADSIGQAPQEEIPQSSERTVSVSQRRSQKKDDILTPRILSPFAIYNVSYTAELSENVVTVVGKVLFEVFRDTGWTQIPLVDNGVGLIDVKVNKGKSFVINQGGKYYLMIDKRGRYNLEIEFLIKAKRERENGPGNFSIDVLPAPIAQFEFNVEEEDLQVFIEPSIKVETTVEEGVTNSWAVMPNTNRVSVRWTKALPKENIEKVELEPKLFVESGTHSSVGGGVIRSKTNFKYSILQSEVSSFRIAYPEDVSILDVNGRDIRDWKITKDKNARYLDVFLNFGVKGQYALNVVYERSIGEGSQVVDMPWVKALGVERETGFYGIAASTNVELAVKSSKKVTEIDTKQLPQGIWNSATNPILLAFRYLNHPIGITVEVTRHEEIPVLIAAVDSANYTTLFTEDGQILTKAIYYVRNNVKQFLRFNLPKGSEIWSAFVFDKPVKPAKDKKGNILLPLSKSKLQGQDLTQFPIEIVYINKAKKMGSFGKLKFDLPKVDIPINEIFWSVYMPYEYSYFNFGGDVRESRQYKSQRTRHGRSRGGVGGLMKRVSQGRAQQTSNSLGDQYSIGNDGRSGKKELNQKIRAEMEGQMATPTIKGVLPIRINIPQRGKTLNFSKLLVVSGKSPSLTMRYTFVWEKIKKVLKFIFLITILALFVLFVKKAVQGFISKRNKTE